MRVDSRAGAETCPQGHHDGTKSRFRPRDRLRRGVRGDSGDVPEGLGADQGGEYGGGSLRRLTHLCRCADELSGLWQTVPL